MNFEILVDQMMIVLKEFQQIIAKKKKEQFKNYKNKELPEEWLILFAIHDYLNRNYFHKSNNDVMGLGQHTFSMTSPTNFRHSWSLTNNNNQQTLNNLKNNSHHFENSAKQNQDKIEYQPNKQQNPQSFKYQVLKHFNSEGNLGFKISEEQQNVLTVIFMRIFYTFYSKKLDVMCAESQKLFEMVEFIALNFIRLDKRDVKSLCPDKQLGVLIEVGKFLQLYGNHECTLNYYTILEMDFHRTFSKQFIKLYELQALNLNKLGRQRESIIKYNLALTLQEQEEEKQLKSNQQSNQRFPSLIQGKVVASISSAAAIPAISKYNLEEPQNEQEKIGSEINHPTFMIDKGIVSYQIAQIYSSLKDFENAIEYYKKSLDYNQKSKGKGSDLTYRSFGSQMNLQKQDEIQGDNNTLSKFGQIISQNSLEQFDQIGTKNLLDNNSGIKQSQNKDLRNCSILQNIAQMYFQKQDFESAQEYLTKAYEIYQSDFKLTEQTKYIKLLTQMCSLYSTKGQFSESIRFAEEALALIEQKYGMTNFKELRSILENLQILYLSEQKVNQSIEVNKRLIKLVEENNLDDIVLAQYLESNGILNYKLKNYEESLRSSYFALRIYRDKFGEKSIEVARIQQNIAQTLSQQKNHKVAFEMAKNCLEIFSQNTQNIEQEELSYVLYNIAQFALNVDNREDAFNYIKQSKELLESKLGKPLSDHAEIVILYKKIQELVNQSSIQLTTNQ